VVALEEHSEEDGRNVLGEAQDVQNVKKNEKKHKVKNGEKNGKYSERSSR
jgi:hypothetical protein